MLSSSRDGVTSRSVVPRTPVHMSLKSPVHFAANAQFAIQSARPPHKLRESQLVHQFYDATSATRP